MDRENPAPPVHPGFTPAERELLDGYPTNDEIARRLGISESAIASRLHRMYGRHGLKKRPAAIRLAVVHRTCCALEKPPKAASE